MCAAALAVLPIGRVVFGAANDKFGGCGSVMRLHDGFGADGRSSATSPVDVPHAPPLPAFAVRGGVLRNDAVALLQSFYSRGNLRGACAHSSARARWHMDPQATSGVWLVSAMRIHRRSGARRLGREGPRDAATAPAGIRRALRSTPLCYARPPATAAPEPRVRPAAPDLIMSSRAAVSPAPAAGDPVPDPVT